MNILSHKKLSAERRQFRVKSRLKTNQSRPRLVVNISHRHVSAQIIDDISGRTLSAVTTVGSQINGSLTEKATWVGQQIAAKALKAKVKQIRFDRRYRLYHGRVKALAEAARQAGLEF